MTVLASAESLLMHKLASLILAACLLLPANVHAWGFTGHEYIGATAYEYLTPQARRWVDSHLQRLDETSLASATTWADRVRGTEEGRFLGPLHFANIPPDEQQIDMQRHCPNRRCVVGAAMNALDVMFDPQANPTAQADELRKFSHWITDLHQPLHLGFARDRGGNDTYVTVDGERINLHRVWDSLIIERKELPAPAQLAAQNPLPESTEDWYEALQLWAEEANHLAREYAYADLEPGDELDSAYLIQAKQVVKEQLTRSAQRMAMIINAAAAANQ
ncbi:hypothetical protein CWE14_00080 [Aliidiomarina soli]|uniref:Endonuclease n=2 Tax=Aliidiomarina soli TaxID=1928574 RepID=A0A432WKW3_9GAMM|nr:hypothetical protein CWE14_00080 [Aliidiomarina soli]